MRAPFLRRALAYTVDYGLIAAYAVTLAAVTLTVFPDFAPASKAIGYGLAAATLTGPVVLVFSVLEARLGATPGKLALGLRVRREGRPVGYGPALVRNLGKFAPWEIAHLGIWLTPDQPFVDPPGMISLVLMNAAMALILIQAGLIAAFGAGVHDWLAGLRVVRKAPVDSAD